MTEVRARERAASPEKSAMATGMRLAPAPVISMESWAQAEPPHSSARARKRRRERAVMSGKDLKIFGILLFEGLVPNFQFALEDGRIFGFGQGR